MKLRDELEAESVQVWHDKRDLKTAGDWDEQIVDAIRSCESLIFVMSHDSVKAKSVCKNEWLRALNYKKPVIPVLLHNDAEKPFRLENRQYIDFSGDFRQGIAKLKNHIRWMASPEGNLHNLKDRLEDAQRELPRAPKELQARVRDDIEQLEKQISEQQRIFDDPHAAIKEVELRIKKEQEKERHTERTISGFLRTKFINPPPGAAPNYFQDRTVETKMIVDFLKDDAQRMITVVGRGGMGKTAMVCRLLKSLESGKLPDQSPDKPEQMNIDGIVYLSESGSHKVNFANIFSDLCLLLPEKKANELNELYKNPKVATKEKMQALLEAFNGGCVILLLDNFESYVDQHTRKITDAELDSALRMILNSGQHGIKVIVTTRIAPSDLAFVHPERQMLLDLEKGLESPYAENILREMDKTGRARLRDEKPELLSLARERTQGNPRALEHIFAILSNDLNTSLPEILADTKNLLHDRVVDVLVGEAFSRLDNTAQRVMEALSVYARPVTPAAVDFMLSPFISGIDSAPVLGRLLNMHFVRKEEGRYYLHPVDRDYAFSRVPPGKPADRESDEIPFTQFALLHRGADYFEQVRKPREDWKTKDDLAPQLAEFDLRCKGENYQIAAKVLLDIDENFLMNWGHFRKVIGMHKLLQGKLADSNIKRRSSGNLGIAYYNVGEYAEAIKYYTQALRISNGIKDKSYECKILRYNGKAYHYLGETRKAIEYYKNAMVIAHEIGSKRDEGILIGDIGDECRVQGYIEKSIQKYEEALEIAKIIGDKKSEGVHLGNLGIAYRIKNDMEKAKIFLDEALKIARHEKNRSNESRWLTNHGMMHRDLGDMKSAMWYYRNAMTIAREIGDKRNEGFLYGEYGTVCRCQGEIVKALEYYEKALKISQDIGDRSNENKWFGNLGTTYKNVGKFKQAIENYEKAIMIASEIKNKKFKDRWLGNLGLAYSDIGHVKKAIEYYQKALAIAKEIGDRLGEGTALGNLGNTYRDIGQVEKTIEYCEKALAISREIGDRRGEGADLGNLGLAYSYLGKVENGIEYYLKALIISREIGNRISEANQLINMGESLVD